MVETHSNKFTTAFTEQRHILPNYTRIIPMGQLFNINRSAEGEKV
jgi:hypothetical protein